MNQYNHRYNKSLVKCIHCNQYHKKMTLYVEDNVRLVELKNSYLVHCTSLNIIYLTHSEKVVHV